MTDPDGAPLPGATIVAESAAGRWIEHADAGGDFAFGALAPGNYDLRAEFPGFCAELQAGLEVEAGTTMVADFSLWLAAPGWNDREGSERLRIVLNLTDAVVHLRIRERLGATSWRLGNRDVVGTEYRAVVVDEFAPAGAFDQPTVRFVQYPAGRVVEEGETRCGTEAPFRDGGEYVVFLRRIAGSEVFRFRGPRFAIPVADGRLLDSWLDDTDVAGVHRGIAVDAFLEALRDLPSEPATSGDDDARVAALRYLIKNETDRLAEAGLPRATERLVFCLGASRSRSAAGGVPTDYVRFNESFGRQTDVPPAYLDRLRSDAYDLFPSSFCDRSTDIGSPVNARTGRHARGIVRVGPAYHVDEQQIEIPASVYRHLMSTAAHVLRLERRPSGWQVVSERFVWGA